MPEVVFDANLGGAFDLFVRTAKRRDEAGRRHRTRDADFTLTADLGAGDRCVALAQNADGGGRQQEAQPRRHRMRRR